MHCTYAFGQTLHLGAYMYYIHVRLWSKTALRGLHALYVCVWSKPVRKSLHLPLLRKSLVKSGA